MDVVVFIGRIIFGLYLLYSGLKHFTGFEGLKGYAAAKKIPAPAAGVAVSGLFLLFGGVTVILGTLLPWGMAAVAIFLILANLTLHNYWTDTDAAQRAGNQVNFGKNAALLGAALAFFQLPLTVWWIH
jgi:putative oxidoreductase